MNLMKAVARVGDLATKAANPLGAVAEVAGQVAQGAETAEEILQTLSVGMNGLDDGQALELVESIVIDRAVDSFGVDEVRAFLRDLLADVDRIAERQERHNQRRIRFAGGASIPQTPQNAPVGGVTHIQPNAPVTPLQPVADPQGFEQMACDLLRAEEGWSDTVYPGPRTGKPHAGCGHLLTRAEVRQYPMGTTVPREQLEDWFDEDLQLADDQVLDLFDPEAVQRGGDARHAVLVSMIFQLGAPKVARFTDFKAAFERGDYQTAANEMTVNSAGDGPSKWHIDTPGRCDRAAHTMRTGRLTLPPGHAAPKF